MAHLLSQQYTFGGAVVPGYYPASVGNPNLGWEIDAPDSTTASTSGSTVGG